MKWPRFSKESAALISPSKEEVAQLNAELADSCGCGTVRGSPLRSEDTRHTHPRPHRERHRTPRPAATRVPSRPDHHLVRVQREAESASGRRTRRTAGRSLGTSSCRPRGTRWTPNAVHFHAGERCGSPAGSAANRRCRYGLPSPCCGL